MTEPSEKPPFDPADSVLLGCAPVRPRTELLLAAREMVEQSGVYLMRDPKGGILYVGKAKNLRNRLVTYFHSGPHASPRTDLLVLRIHHFDVILTETESEALLLECSLIKKHRPRFNVQMKDDKAYPYLRIRGNEAFPRIEWTRKLKRGDDTKYYGPFPSAWGARQVLELLNQAFQLRDCSDNTFRHRSRPCILFQMQRCTAPCVGHVTPIQYREQLEQAVAVLEGKSDSVEKGLIRAMEAASESLDYEQAALIRDQLHSLQSVADTQNAVQSSTEKNRDVLGIARSESGGHAVVLQIRGGRLLAVQPYMLANSDLQIPIEELVSSFLSQYYSEMSKEQEDSKSSGGFGRFITHPREVLVPAAPEGVDILEKVFQLAIRVPESHEDHEASRAAMTHAKHALELVDKRKDAGAHSFAALEEVQQKLGLPKTPSRIECYDISQIQGTDAVASRVVFMDGAPDKNLYRRYKIKTVEGQNDFAMMKEVLGRRFTRDESLPDLVVVDGGKGQLAQAVAILEELNVQGVSVVGLAKARTQSDFQATELKSSFERVFIPGRANPVALKPHSEAYKLLVHIRDEAHRFAITYHRLLRDRIDES